MNIDTRIISHKGYMLAYADEVVFDKYEVKDGEIVLASLDMPSLDEITKVHLFDEEKEVRFIVDEVTKNVHTYILTAEEEKVMDPLFVKEDDLYLNEKSSDILGGKERMKIKVMNRMNFNKDSDYLYLDSYRLAGIIS